MWRRLAFGGRLVGLLAFLSVRPGACLQAALHALWVRVAEPQACLAPRAAPGGVCDRLRVARR